MASIRTSTNFEYANGVNLSKGFTVAGNVINYLQFIVSIKNNIKVGPMDILSVIPHPVSLFSILGNMISEDIDRNFGDVIWEVAPDWRLVTNWNYKFKGKPGFPDEPLYICYTSQTIKCNPSVMPTSIVLKDRSLAFDIFGFYPSVANFDKKSSVYNGDLIEFFPTKQVSVSW